MQSQKIIDDNIAKLCSTDIDYQPSVYYKSYYNPVLISVLWRVLLFKNENGYNYDNIIVIYTEWFKTFIKKII